MAHLRHKRDANARSTRSISKAVKVAVPVAVLATVGAVSAGVLAANPTSDVLASSASSIGSVDLSEREVTVSRSESRTLGRRAENSLERFQAAEAAEAARRATARAVRNADTRLWTTTALNLWTASGEKAREVGLLDERRRVLVTGRKQSGRTEVVVDGQARWVTSGYLVVEKPKVERVRAERSSESSGTPALGGSCTNGTSVSGQPNVIGVHQAVCASFPQITSYGTYRGDGEHAQGLAIDIMVSGATGWEVAEFLRANYSELGISYIMYSQKIWSVDRGSEGWRYVEDRGSATANHYDHVHVTTY